MAVAEFAAETASPEPSYAPGQFGAELSFHLVPWTLPLRRDCTSLEALDTQG